LDIWGCVSRWAGAQEKMDITRKAFERLVRIEGFHNSFLSC